MIFYAIATISNVQDLDVGHHNEVFPIISDSMQREIMFHLINPTDGIQAIKFIHIDSRKIQFMLKVVGMKGSGMRGFDALWVIRWCRRERISGMGKHFCHFFHCS